MNKSAYELHKSMEQRLKFWLNMDAWSLDDAAQVLSGIDPDKTIAPQTHPNLGYLQGAVTLFSGRQIPEPPTREYRLVGGELSDSLELVNNSGNFSDDAEYESRKEEGYELQAYFDRCTSFTRLFNNPSTCPVSPNEWIERALSKKVSIPWLAAAKERGLLPNNMTEEFGKMKQSNIASNTRHSPSNIKREVRKLETQEMYKAWQKAYRILKQKRPNMSDVWYSDHIAKTDNPKNRSAETIRAHMAK
ncbi:MAG: hypothetical protein PHI29_10815 [Gallionella sp.]|nr:hypothetical protein [Gallionella sp.]